MTAGPPAGRPKGKGEREFILRPNMAALGRRPLTSGSKPVPPKGRARVRGVAEKLPDRGRARARKTGPKWPHVRFDLPGPGFKASGQPFPPFAPLFACGQTRRARPSTA